MIAATNSDLTTLVGPATAPTLAVTERTQIVAGLEQTCWRIRGADGAAKLPGPKPSTLEYPIKKLGLQRPR